VKRKKNIFTVVQEIIIIESNVERTGKKNGNNNDWQFWPQHNKPLEIKDQGMFDKILEYIYEPVLQPTFQPDNFQYNFISILSITS